MLSQIVLLLSDTPCVEDNTHCELQMFWQQIFQLGDAFVDSVAPFLFDQPVWQLVCLLKGMTCCQKNPVYFI